MASAEDGRELDGRGQDSLTFFPSLNDDEVPTSLTIRHSPTRDQGRASRPTIASLLFAPRRPSNRAPLFDGYDPLPNDLHDALQEQTSPSSAAGSVLGNEFEGLERSTSAPPESPSSPPRACAGNQKKRKKSNSINTVQTFLNPRALIAAKKNPRPALKSPSNPPSRPSSVVPNKPLAPVEMNYWLPQEELPPALCKYVDATAAKIDGFGFLYEEKRNRRQHDGSGRRRNSRHGIELPMSPTGSIFGRNSRPGSVSHSLAPSGASIKTQEDDAASSNVKWYDFLTPDTSGAMNYLSDIPSTTQLMDTVRAAVSRGATAGSNKATPVTAVSTQTVSPATDAFPESVRSGSSSATNVSIHTGETSSFSNAHPQTAEGLLKTLSDDHERNQQRKKKDFEDFMNRSLAHRLRSEEVQQREADCGNKLHLAPEVHLVEGAVIGFASIGLDGHGVKSKRHELHRLILQGIPVELRSKVWGECMRSQVQGDPEYFQALLTSAEYEDAVDRTVLESIDADVLRTLKDNVYFRDPTGVGTRKLTDVLVALAQRNPHIGYCQGMNLIAGSLLLILPTAEEAFWLMVFLIEHILPDGYLGDMLLTSRADAKVLRRYVGEQMPLLVTCFDRHDVWLEFEVVAISWFVSAFTAVFCGEALYRVWDVIFCWKDGDGFMLCIALALLKLNEKSLVACQGRSEISGYLNARMTDHAVSVDGVVRAANALRKVVRRDDVRARRQEEVDGLRE